MKNDDDDEEKFFMNLHDELHSFQWQQEKKNYMEFSFNMMFAIP